MEIRFTKDVESVPMQALARIVISGPTAETFPNFKNTRPGDSTGLIDIPENEASTILALDVAKFLGEDSSAYAWIQVLGYDGYGTLLEKQCYPVLVTKEAE